VNNFVIIVEGQDKTGKDTLVKALTRKYFSETPLVLHCIGPSSDEKNAEKLSMNYYARLLRTIGFDTPNENFILNRSHIGEMVYAPLYRGYSGEYVIGLESIFLTNSSLDKSVILITLIDSSHSRLTREDDDSFSITEESSHKEMDSFIHATKNSTIPNKLTLDISNKSIEEVHELAFDFVQKIIEG